MKGRNMKSLHVIWFTFLIGIGYASEDEEVTPIIKEPVEIVLVCPEGSKHEGEELPKWVTTKDATEFFCDGSKQETEISE